MDRKAYRAEWYQKNKERIQALHHKNYEATKEATKEQRHASAREFQQTPKGKFYQQKHKAKERGIGWELSFEDWWAIWTDSGKWELRGSGQYMMCRTKDTGPYAIGNVRIDDATGNIKERFESFELA